MVPYEPNKYISKESPIYSSQKRLNTHLWRVRKVLELHNEGFHYRYIIGTPATLDIPLLLSLNNERINKYINLSLDEEWFIENINETQDR